MQRKLIQTSDGSYTVIDNHFNEHFHSVNGAIGESEYVFIEQGLKKLSKTCVNIFEAGFGTGLNAYLTLAYSIKHNISVHYTAVDMYPLDKSLSDQLNYPELIFPECRRFFKKLHSTDWNTFQEIIPSFNLRKIAADLITYNFDEEFDLIYFDAFSPGTQPELWTKEIFYKINKAMITNGLLVTYSSSGNVRRSLMSAGFHVEKIKGPGKKRHMLRAIKIS